MDIDIESWLYCCCRLQFVRENTDIVDIVYIVVALPTPHVDNEIRRIDIPGYRIVKP